MRELKVIRTLGGCGGTLVSRLLGALPDCVVLSETNPRSANLFGGTLNPLAQLKKWHPELLEGLGNFDECELGYPPKFGEFLERLSNSTGRLGIDLIVRDFNYADFLGVPFTWPAAADFSLDAAISGRFQIRAAILVRHPADQLASLRSHASIARVLSAERFLQGSEQFIAARGDTPVFRYEDLVKDPESSLRLLCAALRVPFDSRALSHFSAVESVTGHPHRLSEVTLLAPARSEAGRCAETELMPLSGYDELLKAMGYGS